MGDLDGSLGEHNRGHGALVGFERKELHEPLRCLADAQSYLGVVKNCLPSRSCEVNLCHGLVVDIDIAVS